MLEALISPNGDGWRARARACRPWQCAGDLNASIVQPTYRQSTRMSYTHIKATLLARSDENDHGIPLTKYYRKSRAKLGCQNRTDGNFSHSHERDRERQSKREREDRRVQVRRGKKDK